MPKMFDLLAQEKGIFPYDYYTLKLYIENIGNCLVHDIIATIFDNYIFIKITLTIIFLWNGKTITWSIYSQYTASFLLVHHASTFCQPYNAENRPEAGKTTDFSKDSMQYDRPYQGDVPRRQGYVFSRFYRSVLGLQLI
jgi:hypothetical protein